MGINSFSRLLKAYRECVDKIPLSSLGGGRVAIDAYNVIYAKFKTQITKASSSLESPNEELPMDYILNQTTYSVIRYAQMFLNTNIVPIFVLDGEAPEDKNLVLQTRSKNRDKAREIVNKIQLAAENGEEYNMDDYRRKLVQCTPLRGDMIDHIAKCLYALGVPVLYCVGEGERLCASLNRENRCSAVISADSDTLAFCAPTLVRKVNKDYLECIDLSKLLDALELSFDEFVDLCITAGCDYNTNMPGIGIMRGLALVKKHGVIENFPNAFGKTKLDTSVLNYEICRGHFGYTPSANLVDEGVDIDKELEFNSTRILESVGANLLVKLEIEHFEISFVNYHKQINITPNEVCVLPIFQEEPEFDIESD